MKVALMHFHLRPGGVTSVIRDQAAVLRGEADCLVLTGEAAEGTDASIRVIPGLAYTEVGRPGPDAAETARAVRQAMMDAWGAPADVIHVHNPTLNKNRFLPQILRLLQDGGMRLFLQVHDFAEDGRPSAYNAPGEYPRDCHYGVINSRDREALIASGLDPRGVHVLPNMVHPVPSLPRRHEGTAALIYPVRAIRRKNIGEALLLGTLLQARVTFTLPPRDKADLGRYEEWKRFAREAGLAARFDAGTNVPLENLMAEADAAITTSVNEGFGFAFLEPWTAGLPVAGRRVDHVCGDFEMEGIRFPGLYESLPVPARFFDFPSFSARWHAAIAACYRSFGRTVDEAALSEMTGAGSVDFGLLDEQAQRETITRVLSDPSARKLLDGPELETVRNGLAGVDGANAALIRERFGPERSREQLLAAYQAVRDIPITHRIDKRLLLDFFLKPQSFRMVAQRA